MNFPYSTKCSKVKNVKFHKPYTIIEQKSELLNYILVFKIIEKYNNLK